MKKKRQRMKEHEAVTAARDRSLPVLNLNKRQLVADKALCSSLLPSRAVSVAIFLLTGS